MKLHLFLLAAGASLLGLGDALRCYSCPGGSVDTCKNVAQCGDEDSCLSLEVSAGVQAGTHFSQCIKMADCDFDKLAVLFKLGSFKMNCCQSNLCNSSHSVVSSPLIGLMASLAALWLGFC
ncbi:CD59 glycoprotein-like isoform X2 [Lampris incognitus]|nr:CD59 glycoprotein-like isoform X2 [Lampris incognitus]